MDRVSLAFEREDRYRMEVTSLTPLTSRSGNENGSDTAMADQVGKRTEKLQLMLSHEELKAIDDWRFENRLPSRAAAIRELISRGLHTDEFNEPPEGRASGEFAVVTPPTEDAS